MPITPKPFTEGLRLVKRIFKGRPNILSSEDLNQHFEAVNNAYTRLSLNVGMVRDNWSINLKLSKDTTSGAQNSFETEINILKVNNALPAVVYYKGVRYELPTGTEVNYSGTFTKASPQFPVGYVCLVAKKHTITFSENPVIAGVTSTENPSALPSSDAVVYKEERIVYTDDPAGITLAAEEEYIGVVAIVEPRDVSDFTITEATVAAPASIALTKNFDRTVRYTALTGLEIVNSYSFQYGDDLLEEIGYTSPNVGPLENYITNNGTSDMFATMRDYFNRKFRYVKMVNKWFKFNIDSVNLAIIDLKNQIANLTGNVGTVAGRVVVPKGGIIMFEGTFESFETNGKGKAGTDFAGWAICNGLNGTPDLRGRFVVGAIDQVPSDGAPDLLDEVDPASPTYGQRNPNYAMTDTGGTSAHKLTVGELPAHDHPMPGDILYNGSVEGGISGSPDWQSKPANRTGMTGGNEMHNNLPPYYALAYIKRIA